MLYLCRLFNVFISDFIKIRSSNLSVGDSCPVMKPGILIHVLLKHTYLMGTGASGGKAAGA